VREGTQRERDAVVDIYGYRFVYRERGREEIVKSLRCYRFNSGCTATLHHNVINGDFMEGCTDHNHPSEPATERGKTLLKTAYWLAILSLHCISAKKVIKRMTKNDITLQELQNTQKKYLTPEVHSSKRIYHKNSTECTKGVV